MRIHHLNCGTMCPLGGTLMDGHSHSLTAHLVCHCLLIETPSSGLVLVDTGFGTEDMRHPYSRLSPFFVRLNRIQLREEDTAACQVERLGFRREDVRHIVLSHLDFDHAGGIADFPWAKVHLMSKELRSARHPHSWREKRRYRKSQWTNSQDWQLYRTSGGSKWFGFDAVSDLEGLPPEILLVPLPGHTLGHAGVAVRTQQDWLFYAADAYFFNEEMDPEKYRCPAGLRFYQFMMEMDREMRLANQERLRELVKNRGDDFRIFCAHDENELRQLRREDDFLWEAPAVEVKRSVSRISAVSR